MAELRARAQRRAIDRFPDERLVAARPGHFDGLLHERDRWPGLDLHDGVPASLALREAGRDVRLVIAEGPQRSLRLFRRALYETADHIVVQLRGVGEPVQAGERAHVLEQPALDADELHGYAGILLLLLAEGKLGKRGVRRGRHEERQAQGGCEKARHEFQTARRRRRFSAQTTSTTIASSAMTGRTRAKPASSTEPPSSAVA